MIYIVVLLVVAALFLLLFLLRRPKRLNEMGDKLPGPVAYPIVGNMLQLGSNTHDLFVAIKELCGTYHGSAFRFWMGNNLYVLLSEPKDIEILLGSNKLLNKMNMYDFMHPWLGTGLLTSTASKWRLHRKILTPSFHFKILEQFTDIFHANGDILVECLQDQIGEPAFNLHNFITLSTLDNICETAMGLKINAQKDAESEYVRAVRDQADVVMQRSFKPWLQPNFLFNLTSLKRAQTKALNVLHKTTNEVIKARRQEMARERAVNGGSTDLFSEVGSKRRLAFLDLLIESTYNGSCLTDEDIREEVDTFMFEGHDTTAAAITFSLWLLSWNQDVQDAVVLELQEVWPDPTSPPTLNTLHELKMLERVIKEAMRLFPSVPMYGRQLTEDTALSGGLVAPIGANTLIVAFMAHMNPDVFPDPTKFDPDRFLPENVQGRHPYAYIPFSAGPRNCIGQKFAMLEMKCTLAQVLHNYKFLPGCEKQELKLSADLILTAKEGVPIMIQARQ